MLGRQQCKNEWMHNGRECAVQNCDGWLSFCLSLEKVKNKEILQSQRINFRQKIRQSASAQRFDSPSRNRKRWERGNKEKDGCELQLFILFYLIAKIITKLDIFRRCNKQNLLKGFRPIFPSPLFHDKKDYRKYQRQRHNFRVISTSKLVFCHLRSQLMEFLCLCAAVLANQLHLLCFNYFFLSKFLRTHPICCTLDAGLLLQCEEVFPSRKNALFIVLLKAVANGRHSLTLVRHQSQMQRIQRVDGRRSHSKTKWNFLPAILRVVASHSLRSAVRVHLLTQSQLSFPAGLQLRQGLLLKRVAESRHPYLLLALAC